MATVINAEKLIELLSSVGSPRSTYVAINSETELALGADPFRPSHLLDLAKESVSKFNGAPAAQRPAVPPTTSRRTGEYWIRVEGRQVDCGSLRELLSKGLLAIEEARPGTLEKLSKKKLRSRRIVARDPELLFDSPRLVEKFAAPLTEGWWFGTNNSAPETNAWLERAFAYAGLDPTENRTSMATWPKAR